MKRLKTILIVAALLAAVDCGFDAVDRHILASRLQKAIQEMNRARMTAAVDYRVEGRSVDEMELVLWKVMNPEGTRVLAASIQGKDREGKAFEMYSDFEKDRHAVVQKDDRLSRATQLVMELLKRDAGPEGRRELHVDRNPSEKTIVFRLPSRYMQADELCRVFDPAGRVEQGSMALSLDEKTFRVQRLDFECAWSDSALRVAIYFGGHDENFFDSLPEKIRQAWKEN